MIFFIAFFMCDRGKKHIKERKTCKRRKKTKKFGMTECVIGRSGWQEKNRKLENKQYTTVDNSVQLLYTVYREGETEQYAYYFKPFLHGADL